MGDNYLIAISIRWRVDREMVEDAIIFYVFFILNEFKLESWGPDAWDTDEDFCVIFHCYILSYFVIIPKWQMTVYRAVQRCIWTSGVKHCTN